MYLLHKIKSGLFNVVAGGVFLTIFLIATGVRADEATDREFQFAAGLVKLNLPEYAEKVADRILLAHPEEESRCNVIRAESLIARRRFKQAEDIVAKMPKESPKAQAIMLALADGYYMVGEYERCGNLYQEFFNQYTNQIPTDPDLLRFYRESAYKFGQILVKQNKPKAAADMYDLFLKTHPEKDLAKQAQQEQLELWLKAARDMTGADRDAVLQKAQASCNDVLWTDSGLWFGRSIVSMAQLEILRGHKDNAIKLLGTNLKILRKFDDLLKEKNIPISESPFAGARSLLGSLYLDEGDIVLGSRGAREIEALQYFDRAYMEIDNVWDLIVKVNKRDALTVAPKKDKEGKEIKEPRDLSSLPGTATQRQRPFEEIAAEAKKFDDLLATCSEKGWDPAVTEKANALKGKSHTLLKAISEYPKELGVTPGPEVAIATDFKGREYIKHGLEFLADEAARKEEAVKLYTSALQEFYNVFADYPGSEWNAAAGEKVSSLKDKLQALTGKEITIEAKKGGKEKMAVVAIKEGHNLFFRKEYKKAIQQYLVGLKDYPEGGESVVALANMMECYATLKDPLHVRMLAQYLAERFRSRPEAAQALLRIGRIYFEAKDRVMYEYLYNLYLASFPEHPSAPTIWYMLGEQRWQAKDYEAAVPYYREILKRFVKTPYYVKALDRIGWSYYLGTNYSKAADGFSAYLAEAQPSLEKSQAKLCLADSYRQMNDFTNAVRHYQELVGWLSAKDSGFSASASDIQKNKEILEQAAFFQAYCMGRVSQGSNQNAADVQAAVDIYRKFIEQYPESKLAPTALSSLGAVLLAAGKSDEAAKVFEELSAKYPKSEAGQNARLAMIKSLLDIDQIAKARDALAEMAKDAAKYPIDQFVRVGQMMLDKGENESAIVAFSKVTDAVKAGGQSLDAKTLGDMDQRALYGLGKACFAMKKYEDAASSLSALNTKYPLSALFYEARFLLGRTYRELKKSNEAIEVLKEVFQRATDQNLINRATMELADIQLAQGDKAAALASYQRIILLGKLDDPATRPLYREALLQSIPLFSERGQSKDVIENADLFSTQFPSDAKLDQVRQWKATAIMNLSTGAGSQANEKKAAGEAK